MQAGPDRFARRSNALEMNARSEDGARLERPAVRRGFDIVAYGFLSGFLLQVMLAGWSLFNEPDRWSWHRDLGHCLEILAFALVALAFAANIPPARRRIAILLFILTVVQTMLAGIGGPLGALHPLNALVVGGLAYRLAYRV